MSTQVIIVFLPRKIASDDFFALQILQGPKRTDLVCGHKVEVQDAPLGNSGVHKHEGVLVQVHGRQQLLALLPLHGALGCGLNLVDHQLRQVGQDAYWALPKTPRLPCAQTPTRVVNVEATSIAPPLLALVSKAT